MPEDPKKLDSSGLLAMFQSILQQQQQQSTTIAIIQRDLAEMREQTSSANKLVREVEVTQRGMMIQSALVEHSLKETTVSMQDLRKVLDIRASEDIKGKWQVFVVVAAGILSVASAIITALLAAHKP